MASDDNPHSQEQGTTENSAQSIQRPQESVQSQETNPRTTNPEFNTSLEELNPEEKKLFDAFIEGLRNFATNLESKNVGFSVETSPEGWPVLKSPETPEANEILCNALLGESLPAEITHVSPTQDDPMGLFDKHRICLCSPIIGAITKDGQPLQGAEIIRRCDMIHLKDQTHTDRTKTNEKGQFDFKPLYARKWKYVLYEIVTDQKLLIRHDGKLYLGWSNVSHGRDLNDDYCTKVFPPYHIKLDFNGDLSQATPLPEDVDLDENMSDQGFFNAQVVCVASYLRFFVTLNGESVQGVKVIRTAEHIGYDNYEQTGISDGDGEVNLKAIYAPLLIHKNQKTEVRQKVILLHEGKEYLGWEMTKGNPWERGEFNSDDNRWGLNAEITAELSDNPDLVRNISTDPNRCGKNDNLPNDAIKYKGLFAVTRYNSGYEKHEA